MSSKSSVFTEGDGYDLQISREDHNRPGMGFLYLRYRADDQLLKEFADCDETIGQPKVTDGLRLELDCNRAATFEEVQAAVDAMVTRLNQRRGFKPAAYEPRWSIGDNAQSDYDFTVRIFPLTSEVIEEIERNPAVHKVSPYSKGRGIIWISLRQPFDPSEVRPDLKAILRTFVGKEFAPEPKNDNEES